MNSLDRFSGRIGGWKGLGGVEAQNTFKYMWEIVKG